MGLGFPGLRKKNLLGRLAARGGAADGSPLSGGDPVVRAVLFRFIYHGGRAEGHGGPQESCRG